jgi:hypothetical protein
MSHTRDGYAALQHVNVVTGRSLVAPLIHVGTNYTPDSTFLRGQRREVSTCAAATSASTAAAAVRAVRWDGWPPRSSPVKRAFPTADLPGSRVFIAHDAGRDDDELPGGSENVVVARLLPTAMGWLCTRGGCGMAFADLAVLEAHAKSHTEPSQRKRKTSASSSSSHSALQPRKKPKNSTPNEFVCTFDTDCVFTTDDEQHLRSHIHEHVSEQDVTSGSVQSRRVEEHLRSWAHAGEHPFVCPREGCWFRARTAQGLEQHVIRSNHTNRRKNEDACLPPHRKQARVEVQAHSQVQVQVQVQEPVSKAAACRCPWAGCNFSTALKRNLKAHTRSHTGERPFHCVWNGCSYSSSRAGDLKQHARTHTGEKPFVCGWEGCDYTAAQASNLKRHSLVHTGERPFPCTWDGCEYRSTTASNLKHHARTHTRERPFGCTWDGCEYRAARAGDLKKHLRKHTTRVHTAEKSFGCYWEGCTYTALEPQELWGHITKDHATTSSTPMDSSASSGFLHRPHGQPFTSTSVPTYV